MEVPAEYGRLRFWRNTSVADLAPGQKATLPEGVLGYEWDEDLENGHRPAGMIRMSSTTRQVGSYILDYGNIYGEGTATHHLTLYRHSSGALVFGAGTVQWPWGLDEDHDRGGTPADQRMRQATMNLFADMGAQPATIQPGLVRATASTDRTPPRSVITSPISGASVQAGTPVTITGTATDAEGVVGGVEVSVDNGATWKVASGRENWSYTWTPERTGEFTLLARASDDSANREIPTAGTTVTSKSRPCPCSFWSDATVPSVASSSDAGAIELGIRFRSEEAGYITGVRFYKGVENTGTHLGHLWDDNGEMLAEATFRNETASGWQQVNFAEPVAVQANRIYTASYHTTTGHFAVDRPYFNTPIVNAPLRAVVSGSADGVNGVYKGGEPGFPTGSYLSSNYWVDVVFKTTLVPDTTAPKVSAVSPGDGATDVSAGTTVSATFDEAMDASTLTGSTVQLRDDAGVRVTVCVAVL
jgi:hypothetical protein